MATRHLPVVADEPEPARSSLRQDGSRNYVHPADVRGRFATARKFTFALLIGVYAALPWVKIAGRPAVFLDVDDRRFYLFGMTFNAQDVWLMFFLLTGVGFGLVYVTAALGRVWCGWACPQTVFLEGIYRRIERWIEGPREKRLRRNAAPWDADKVWRKVATHTLYALTSVVLAHVFVSYFVSLPRLFQMVRHDPGQHPEAFAWMLALSGALYFNFSWFREQLCLVICPYGRLQSVLTDQHSLVVGYDVGRGEPRGKAAHKAQGTAGDCVDCGRCVAVCPTGIDIRNGLQLDCIACTACIDACDDIMDKLHRPRGLIRYDSLAGIEGKPRKIVRPRMMIYSALGLVGAVVAFFAFRTHEDLEANVLRLAGAPYTLEGDSVRNAFEIHLVNKSGDRGSFTLEPEPAPGVSFVVPLATVTVDSMGSVDAPLFVTVPRAAFHGDFPVRVRVRRTDGDGAQRVVTAPFLGPSR